MKTRSNPVYVEDYTCPICMSVAIDPVGTPCCAQLFCHECLGDALKHRERCPMDRQRLTFDQVRKIDKNGIEWKRLSELPVSCKEDELGCDWTGVAKDHEGHAKSCRFVQFSKLVAGMKLLEESIKFHREITKTRCEQNKEQCDLIGDSLSILIRLRRAYESNDLDELLISFCMVNLRNLQHAVSNNRREILCKLITSLAAQNEAAPVINEGGEAKQTNQDEPADKMNHLKIYDKRLHTIKLALHDLKDQRGVLAKLSEQLKRYDWILLRIDAANERELLAAKYAVDNREVVRVDDADLLRMTKALNDNEEALCVARFERSDMYKAVQGRC